jgi:hypothetical protein
MMLMLMLSYVAAMAGEHGPCIMVGDREEILAYPEEVQVKDVDPKDLQFERLLRKGYYALSGWTYLRTDRARTALKQEVWQAKKGHRSAAAPSN